MKHAKSVRSLCQLNGHLFLHKRTLILFAFCQKWCVRNCLFSMLAVKIKFYFTNFFDWNTNQGCLLIKTGDNLKTNRNIRTKYFPLE